MSEPISYEDFEKVDIRIGTIVNAERVLDTDKLIKCTVDFGLKPSAVAGLTDHLPSANGLGERDLRTIVSGIALWKPPEQLIGKQCPYIVNLKPRMIRGILSEGMLLAAGSDTAHALLHPEGKIPPGMRLG